MICILLVVIPAQFFFQKINKFFQKQQKQQNMRPKAPYKMCSLRPHTLTKVASMGQPDINLAFKPIYNKNKWKIFIFFNNPKFSKIKNVQISKNYQKSRKIRNPI